jgi:hypothetical protein
VLDPPPLPHFLLQNQQSSSSGASSNTLLVFLGQDDLRRSGLQFGVKSLSVPLSMQSATCAYKASVRSNQNVSVVVKPALSIGRKAESGSVTASFAASSWSVTPSPVSYSFSTFNSFFSSSETADLGDSGLTDDGHGNGPSERFRVSWRFQEGLGSTIIPIRHGQNNAKGTTRRRGLDDTMVRHGDKAQIDHESRIADFY